MKSIAIDRLFDRYDLLARVAPGLLPVLVPGASILIAYPEFQPHGMSQWAGSGVVGIAVLWLLASWARSRGRQIQEHLKKEWGGLPTEILLRHSDPTIEALTKRRYHAALKTIARDISFPDPPAERSDPDSADAAYRSAIRRLVEGRRGAKFQLILDDNIAYGFWRNLLGMKGPAILIALAVMSIIGIPELTAIATSSSDVISVVIKPHRIIGAMLDLSWLAFLGFAVTSRQVWDAGKAYAERLLASLDLTTNSNI